MEGKWETKGKEQRNNGLVTTGDDERRTWDFETRTGGIKIERNNSEAGDLVNEDGGHKKEGGKAGGEDGESGHNPRLKKEKMERDSGRMQSKEGDLSRTKMKWNKLREERGTSRRADE